MNNKPSIFQTQIAGRYISNFLDCVDRINARAAEILDDCDVFRCRSFNCQVKDLKYIISRRMAFDIFKDAFDTYVYQIKKNIYNDDSCVTFGNDVWRHYNQNFYLPLIVRHGLVEHLKYIYRFLVDCFGQTWVKRFMIGCKLGNIAILQRHHQCFSVLCEFDCVIDKDIIKSAAIVGDLRIIKNIYEKLAKKELQEIVWDQSTVLAATRKGRFECLKYMLEHGCAMSSSALLVAIKQGHFRIFIYLMKIKNSKLISYYTTYTSETFIIGLLLRAAFDRGEVRFVRELFKAINNNQNLLNEMKLFVQQFIMDRNYLVKKSRIKCLKYIISLGFSLNENSCYYAAEGGSMKMLKFCHESGAPWSMLVTEIATKNKNFKGLRYCYENGCRWNFTVYMWAIVNDDVNCLKYATENDCPTFNLTFKYMLYIAYVNQSTNCRDYLLRSNNFDIDLVSFSQEEWLEFLHDIDVFNLSPFL